MAIIKKFTNNKCWKGCGEKELSYHAVGNVNWYSHMENSLEIPYTTENRTLIWSSNPTPEYISRENYNLERYMHPNVHNSIIYSSEGMEATLMSINRWTDNENVVHIFIEILLSHKKEQSNATCSNMYRPRDCPTEWT